MAAARDTARLLRHAREVRFTTDREAVKMHDDAVMAAANEIMNVHRNAVTVIQHECDRAMEKLVERRNRGIFRRLFNNRVSPN